MQGYCMKCKAKKEMRGAQKVTMKNGRSALKGECSDCRTAMFRLQKKGE